MGHPIAIASFYGGGGLELELRGEGVPVFVLGKRGRWDLFRFSARILDLVKRLRPDLVHGYLGAGNIVCVFLRACFPALAVVWGIRASNMDLTLYDWIWRVEDLLLRILSPWTNRIVVNSQAGHRHLVSKGYPSDKIAVIPNGVDLARFCPDAELGAHTRGAWGINPDEKAIGLVARLDPMKDHETFVRAAALLACRRKDVKFVCVGADRRGRLRALKDLAEALGVSPNLIWLGERSDMPAVYNAFDVTTLSSAFGEGFPNAVGESMACGVPCVVTDVGDCAYLVGDTGLVVPPRDPDALARAWSECLELDLATLGTRARERIVENFGAERMVEETIRVLNSAVERRRRMVGIR